LGAGIHFEPLEPRLLLSGGSGAGGDSSSHHLHLNSQAGFPQQIVALRDVANALHSSQNQPGTAAFLDIPRQLPKLGELNTNTAAPISQDLSTVEKVESLTVDARKKPLVLTGSGSSHLAPQETKVTLSPVTQQGSLGVLATFTVNTTADTIDVNPGDGKALDASGKTSLRAAIMEANALGGDCQIILGPGTYKLSLGPSGDDNAVRGDLDITGRLTITGAGASATVIDGNSLDRVFHLKGAAANLTLTDLTVQGGRISGNGGGIYVEDHNAQLTASEVVITGNIGTEGAGIYNNGTMTLTDVRISNNGNATTDSGGGIYSNNASTLNRVTINGNYAGNDGGGIFNDTGAASLSLTNVTISGNTATDKGGGLHSHKPVMILNSTFTLNSANYGGGIWNSGFGVNVKNTIVAGNLANMNPDLAGTFVSQGNNLIGAKGGSNGFTNGVNNDQVGTTVSPIDPKLGPLRDNGGFAWTHALLPGSPAINTGTAVGAPTVDERGITRDATPDIGAFEKVNNAPDGLPTITGTIAEDQTLSASTAGISDADGLGSFSFQWLRNGTTITGATASTYTLGDADVGAQISVRVSYTDGGGTNESLTSSQVGPVANVNDAPMGLPSISGTPTENLTLSAVTSGISDADGLGPFSYQWLRNGTAITGATNSNYTLDDADVGAQISVRVSYTDGQGTNESVTSAKTAAVANVNDAPAGLPTISGIPTEDQTLSAVTSGISDADGLGPFSYQWLRNGTAITGAIASTYTLGDADVGVQISVRVSYTDGHGTNESVTSAKTAAVANVNDNPTGLPVINGTVTKDQTLTVVTSGIGDADGLGAFSYQWLRDGSAITGATAPTYTLGDADVGAQISVQVSYTDGHGTNESLSSAQVGPVTGFNNTPSGLPVITGTATEDQTLTVDASGISDADGLGPFSYQWLRDGVAITGATNGSYALVDADVGTQISVQVSYTDGGGTNELLTSSQVGPVANVNDAPAGLPTIIGTVTEDQTLTANTAGISDADGLGVFGYQWLRNGTAITGATASSYTLGDSDVGAQISVQVSYTDGHGTDESVTSAQTAAVANVNDAPAGQPTIAGTATEDQTLTAVTSGISDADGLGAFNYQWLRNGTAITGATASSYTLGDSDVGAQISVQVSYTDCHGTSESVTSTQTAPVANVNDAPAGQPTITGTATEDQTLTAVTNCISDADGLGAFSYQWLRNGTGITGATASTYTLGDSDVGAQISVRVSYTDGHGTSESVTSTQTAPVANVNDAPAGRPTVTGTTTENQTLTAVTNGISDADGLGAFSYQWLRNGTAIQGATNSTYTLAGTDVGAKISVLVSYTDGHGTPESVTSVQTAAVTKAADTPTTPGGAPSPSVPNQPDTSPDQNDKSNDPTGTPDKGGQSDSGPNKSNPGSNPDTARKNTFHGSSTQPESRLFPEAVSRDTIPAYSDTAGIRLSDVRGTLSNREPGDKQSVEIQKDLQQEHASQMSIANTYDRLRNALNAVKNNMTKENQARKLFFGSAIVSSVGLSVGYVVWLLRGGMLLGTLLSSLPAWQILDPLPILARKKDGDHADDDESLESILRKKRRNRKPKQKTTDASLDAEAGNR
jgi:hypothetical protein